MMSAFFSARLTLRRFSIDLATLMGARLLKRYVVPSSEAVYLGVRSTLNDTVELTFTIWL